MAIYLVKERKCWARGGAHEGRVGPVPAGAPGTGAGFIPSVGLRAVTDHRRHVSGDPNWASGIRLLQCSSAKAESPGT